MTANTKESDKPRKVNIIPGSNRPKCQAKGPDIRIGVVCYTRTLGRHPN